MPPAKQLFFNPCMLFLGLSYLAQKSENPYNLVSKMDELRAIKEQ
jgi:hypothetical protein